MKRTMKQLFALALALLLVGSLFACGGSDEKPADETEKEPDGKLETFLSDAKGDWYAYGNLNDQKITINEDGTFIADYDATTTNEGTISYDEDSERFMFEGQEQSSYGDLLEDDILRCWGCRYYRAEQSIAFGQFNGNWYLDGDTNMTITLSQTVNGCLWLLNQADMRPESRTCGISRRRRVSAMPV